MPTLPSLVWAFGPVHVLAIALVFLVGLASHELMHIGALKALGEPYDAEIAPDGWLSAVYRGSLVEVEMQRMAPKWRVAVVMLAPLFAAVPPLASWSIALTYPMMEVGTVLAVAVWFAVALPSPHDIATVALYDPENSVPTEVSA